MQDMSSMPDLRSTVSHQPRKLNPGRRGKGPIRTAGDDVCHCRLRRPNPITISSHSATRDRHMGRAADDGGKGHPDETPALSAAVRIPPSRAETQARGASLAFVVVPKAVAKRGKRRIPGLPARTGGREAPAGIAIALGEDGSSTITTQEVGSLDAEERVAKTRAASVASVASCMALEALTSYLRSRFCSPGARSAVICQLLMRALVMERGMLGLE